VQPVLDLLQKLDTKSNEVRKDQMITLVPFVRTTDMAVFSKSVANTGGYLVEAFAFDDAGVTFGSLDEFAQMEHPSYIDRLDFDLGITVLLARCDVILVICQDGSEFDEIRSRLTIHQSTFVSIALIAIRDEQSIFLEINPVLKENDETGWLIDIRERWKPMNRRPESLPWPKFTILGFLFPLLYSLTIGRRSENVKKRRRKKGDQCREGMGLSPAAISKLSPQDVNSLEGVLNVICPFFVRHDMLGRLYSNLFRTTCFLVPFLIVVSTVLAVAAGIDNLRGNVWHVSEGILLIAAAVLFVRSKIAKHHRKWVEHRLLTELLRPALLSSVFHTIPRLTLPSEDPDLWVDRSRILLQHFRAFPSMRFITPRAALLSARISAILDFSKFQAKWHMEFADQHRAAEKRLARICTWAFLGTLLLCGGQLVIVYYLEAIPGYLQAMTTVANVLMMLTLISAGMAFVLLILSHQLGFEAIAERSSNAAEHFETLRRKIEERAHLAEAREVYAWAHECAEAILAEQHSWCRQIPLIRMHL
jgi:hypothetical protein